MIRTKEQSFVLTLAPYLLVLAKGILLRERGQVNCDRLTSRSQLLRLHRRRHGCRRRRRRFAPDSRSAAKALGFGRTGFGHNNEQARGPDKVSTPKMEKFMGLSCELAASDPALKLGIREFRSKPETTCFAAFLGPPRTTRELCHAPLLGRWLRRQKSPWRRGLVG